ncbi:Nitrogen fixation protein rnfB [Peptoniphilus harei]|uniref:Nitrogen fixation protein rnfB n=1 Tax=Peptoniphilus harei TaxID=54005 RepID=A0A2X1XLK7_9FIRM|nr:Nitrogen fixation protein rnfB [Peptoniphilus harei]
MEISAILTPMVFLGIAGAFFGIILSIASKVFYVEVDPKVAEVRDALPGANCGACGFPGCDGLAEAIANGTSQLMVVIWWCRNCEKVSQVMGVNAENVDRNVAVVHCQVTVTRQK